MKKVKDWPNELRVHGFPDVGENGEPGGFFLIPAKDKFMDHQGYCYWVVVSISYGWEHVSVTVRKKGKKGKLMCGS